jgi:mannose-6-phosphate isomerase-like protein (cupin superfamily)
MYIEKESFSSASSHENNSKRNGSFSSFDLPVLIENLKHDQSWKKGELKAMILLKNPSKKIVLALLHENTEIRSFQADESTTFRIIEGKVKFHIGNESLILKRGELLTLNEKVKYSINSLEETALLIVLASK